MKTYTFEDLLFVLFIAFNVLFFGMHVAVWVVKYSNIFGGL